MSSALAFLLTRTLRNERALKRLSSAREGLASELRGLSVALVGNARSLSDGNHGMTIDKADLVARVNRAPMPSSRTHGTRTDWLMLATSIGTEDLDRVRPRRILWMSPKRKRLSWAVVRSPGFYLHDPADTARLHEALGAPPTTGLMAIDLILSLDPASLTLYGFDFFASLSFTGSRRADQVPHDFAAEKRWVAERAASDPRLRLA